MACLPGVRHGTGGSSLSQLPTCTEQFVYCCSTPIMQSVLLMLQVRIGSLGDPDDLPGLAHFTEHMLFYASEKYPLEDEYSKFVVWCCYHAFC